MGDLIESLRSDGRLLSLGVVSVFGFVAAFTDIYSLKVSNWLTVPLLLSGLGFHALFPLGLNSMFAMAGILVGFGMLLPGCLLGGVGAGDVKLLTGIGAWVGPVGVCAVGVLTGIFLLCCTIVMTCLSCSWRSLFSRMTVACRISGRSADGPRLPSIHDREGDAWSREERRRVVPLAALMAASTWILLFIRLWPV